MPQVQYRLPIPTPLPAPSATADDSALDSWVRTQESKCRAQNAAAPEPSRTRLPVRSEDPQTQMAMNDEPIYKELSGQPRCPICQSKPRMFRWTERGRWVYQVGCIFNPPKNFSLAMRSCTQPCIPDTPCERIDHALRCWALAVKLAQVE